MDIEKRDDLCRRLRETVKEFGNGVFSEARMVGPEDVSYVSSMPYITCPTMGSETLAEVPYKVARFFEDAQ